MSDNDDVSIIDPPPAQTPRQPTSAPSTPSRSSSAPSRPKRKARALSVDEDDDDDDVDDARPKTPRRAAKKKALVPLGGPKERRSTVFLEEPPATRRPTTPAPTRRTSAASASADVPLPVPVARTPAPDASVRPSPIRAISAPDREGQGPVPSASTGDDGTTTTAVPPPSQEDVPTTNTEAVATTSSTGDSAPSPPTAPPPTQDVEPQGQVLPSREEWAILRAELAEVRTLLLGSRAPASVPSTTILEPVDVAAPLEAPQADPFSILPLRTIPNGRGDMPPASVCHLSSAMFPAGKKSTTEYHPPQVHSLAAHRLYKELGYPPFEGRYSSATSFVLALLESPAAKFPKSVATAVALYSGRLGSRGASVMMFAETSDDAELERGSTNQNFDINFGASLDPSPVCNSAEDIPPCTKARPAWAAPPSPVQTAHEFRVAKLNRELTLDVEAKLIELQFRDRLAQQGVPWPDRADPTGEAAYALDKARQSALTSFAKRSRISLMALVELIRGQTTSDYRPNKALVESDIMLHCKGYKDLDAVLDVVRHGVHVPLRANIPRPSHPPENHQSAHDRLRVLRKNVRKEQDAGRCIVVDMDLLEQWPEVVISPYGVVDKAGVDALTDGRTIQNLSFPLGRSVNDATDKDVVPSPDYRPVEMIALEILRLRELHPDAIIFLLAGDVALAFRHVHLHSASVHLFGGLIPEDNALVIELACPFGWTGSPGYYELFGSAISYAHGHVTDRRCNEPFFSYHWVDDHVLVAAGDAEHLADCERSLRAAMLSVLGPRAINEKKFTGWAPTLKVLGLIFDTTQMTVAMPASKIDKARTLVCNAYHCERLPSRGYRSLLGSLRHVATCIRPARPFLQRLRGPERYLHFTQHVPVTDEMRLDLTWWWNILHSPRLNGVSLNYFKQLPDPDHTILMDASDTGLCAVDPSTRRFLLYEFNTEEVALISAFKAGDANGFDINYRELLSSAFATLAWADSWSLRDATQTHVRFRIDNTSAVAWHQHMASRNPRAQILIRFLSLWEDRFSLRFSASHIAGDGNVLADAGSRMDAGGRTGQRLLLPRDLALYYRLHAVADSTYTQYSRHFALWRAWTTTRGLDPWLRSMDTASQTDVIAAFILFGTHHGFGTPPRPARASTLSNYLAGISHFFRAHNYPFPSAHAQVVLLLKGISRFNRPPESKHPASLQLLATAHAHVNLSIPHDQALWGVLSVGFFFLLRRSEIAADDSSCYRWFCLRARDIEVLDNRGFPTSAAATADRVRITLHGSKTQQGGPPVVRLLRKSGHSVLCPVIGALWLLKGHHTLPDDFPASTYPLPGNNMGAVTARTVTLALRRAAIASGHNPRGFSSHSLRSGGATHMYKSGIDPLTIQFQGRWKSGAYKLYTRLCTESVQSIASSIVRSAHEDTTLQHSYSPGLHGTGGIP